MIKISSNSLKDFQTCALLYSYRHKEDTKIPEILDIRDRRMRKFDDTIKRVVAFFFYKKQALAEPSYQALLNRWQKLWFAEGTTAVDIANAKNEVAWNSDTSFTNQAAAALLQFHEEFSDNIEQEVVLVDEKFCVPLNKQVALEGVLDVVLREKDKDGVYRYKIYKWITSSVKRSVSYWAYDIAFLDYAFRYRNNNTQIKASFYIWSFGGNLIGSREVALDNEDYNLVKYWTNEVLETKIFAPRRDLTSYCKSCPWYSNSCAQWRAPTAIGAE